MARFLELFVAVKAPLKGSFWGSLWRSVNMGGEVEWGRRAAPSSALLGRGARGGKGVGDNGCCWWRWRGGDGRGARPLQGPRSDPFVWFRRPGAFLTIQNLGFLCLRFGVFCLCVILSF